MNPAAPLPADEAWEALRAQLEWRRGFGLFFLFAPHQGAGKALRERVSAWLQIHTLRLRRLQAASAEHLRSEMIAGLFDEAIDAPAGTPIWIEAEAAPFDEKWNRARAVFLARLNERRGALESDLPGPLIIVLPLAYRQEARAIAPDLWHVRVWSGDLSALAAPDTETSASISAEVNALLPLVQSGAQLSSDSTVDEALKAWQTARESAGPARSRIHLGLGFEAFDRAFEAMRHAQAKPLADELVTLARERIGAAPGDYGALRDLSVSLNKVGGVDQALGQYEAARAAYAESLALCRNINAAVGDTPQGVFDLAWVLRRLAGLPETIANQPSNAVLRSEARALLERLRNAVGPMWNGNNLDQLLEQLKSP